jgi:hypothetical protein
MKKPEAKPANKSCKRCNKHKTKDVICASCKNELLSSYENSIDWQTAYEVEKAHQNILKYKMREDF